VHKQEQHSHWDGNMWMSGKGYPIGLSMQLCEPSNADTKTIDSTRPYGQPPS
jgi:hypothetical protein